MIQCSRCGVDFEPKNAKQVFCSTKCRVYANRSPVDDYGLVYCLRNPLDNSVFYIGKTIMSLDVRLSGHIHDAKKMESDKILIIKSIIESGQDVIIEQIEMVPRAILSERETFWIREFNKKGSITNKTKKKGNPTGVRFDNDKLELIKKEQGLDTPQQVVDYLMGMYKKNNPVKIEKIAEKIKDPVTYDRRKIKLGF